MENEIVTGFGTKHDVYELSENNGYSLRIVAELSKSNCMRFFCRFDRI